MGIISKLKSALGIAEAGGDRPRGDGTMVAVEREPEPEPEHEPEAESERAVKGVDPVSGTTDEPKLTDAEGASTTAGESLAGEPVDSIKGIGAAYAGRLADAGVHTVDDLAEADANDLAAETGLGAGRIGNWIERARARSR